jgi:putative transposase
MSTKELYFTEKDYHERLAEIKKNFEEDLKNETLKLAKSLIEECLEEELEKVIRAKYYEQTEGRVDYRNGSYTRGLETEIGYIPGINVPRAREIEYDKSAFEKYARRQKEVNELLLKIFLKGVSTREVGKVVEPLLGINYSAGTISNISKRLDAEVRIFHTRAIKDEYIYIILDGIVVKIKNSIKTEKMVVLAAYGITEEGLRELIGFKIANRENEGNWSIFLSDLYNRGLEGSKTRLIITDGNKGLISAIETIYPGIKRQRCWVHKLRNVADKLPKKLHNTCLKEAKGIYQAKNKKEAIKRYKEWKEKWGKQKQAEKAVKCIEIDIEELLIFYEFPKEHWKKIRTTNAIERNFREVRRRIRTMNVFTNEKSCNRIIYAIFCSLNEKWKNHPLKEFKNKKNFTQNY